MPANYAGELAAGVVVTRGLEGCIYLFPQVEFERLGVRLRQQSFTDTRARKLRRRLLPQAHAVNPDSQRRVLIPQWLREHAGITDKVLIAGMDTYVELWTPEAWAQQEEALEAQLSDEEFFAGLDI